MPCRYLNDRRSAVTGIERGASGLEKVLQSSMCYLEISQKTCTVLTIFTLRQTVQTGAEIELGREETGRYKERAQQ